VRIISTEAGLQVAFMAVLPAGMTPHEADVISATLVAAPDAVFVPAVFGSSAISVMAAGEVTHTPATALVLSAIDASSGMSSPSADVAVAAVRLTLPASMELSVAAAAKLCSALCSQGSLRDAQVTSTISTDASGRAVRVVEISAQLPAVSASQRSQQAGALDSAARAALETAIPGATSQLMGATEAGIDGSVEFFGADAAAVATEGEVQVISFSASVPVPAGTTLDVAARQAYCASVQSFLVSQGERDLQWLRLSY
jgi:hypothetical protein